ncbi:MAG TPA: hypothetical protein VLC09_17105 [Polyangiaceae bacterium]|nr:hypothetical protein [Polyangiaceae bacterium]
MDLFRRFALLRPNPLRRSLVEHTRGRHVLRPSLVVCLFAGTTALLGGCGQLLGLDGYKAIDGDSPSDDNDDDISSGGSGTGGTPSTACEDTADGTGIDRNCTAALPVCDGGSCVECADATHCDDDDNCTADTCNAGVCDHVATTQQVLMNRQINNGSFEDVTVEGGDDWATGWFEEGGSDGSLSSVPLTYDCTDGCNFLGNDDPYTNLDSEQGARIMWLGSFENWQDLAFSPVLNVPANANALRVVVTTKVYTLEPVANGALDTYKVSLVSEAGDELWNIYEGSNLDAPAVETDEFALDSIDESFTVPPAWQSGGMPVQLKIETLNSATDGTDFGFDDIRVIADLTCN